MTPCRCHLEALHCIEDVHLSHPCRCMAGRRSGHTDAWRASKASTCDDMPVCHPRHAKHPIVVPLPCKHDSLVRSLLRCIANHSALWHGSCLPAKPSLCHYHALSTTDRNV